MNVIIFGVIQERLHMARFILQYYLANVFDKWTPLCQLKYSCFTEKKWKEKKKRNSSSREGICIGTLPSV
jgi:hypothetical protein